MLTSKYIFVSQPIVIIGLYLPRSVQGSSFIASNTVKSIIKNKI
jgi:hypothetical protein